MNTDLELLIAFLQPIRELLLDETISEVMGNPDGSWWYERRGQLYRAENVVFDARKLSTGLDVIANKLGRKLDAEHPVLNVQLPDGSRLAAVLPPVVRPTPAVTIRKFSAVRLTIEDMIRSGSLPADLSVYLRLQIEAGKTMLISGGTGSGKSTLIRMMLGQIRDRGESAIIYDPACEFVRRFYDKGRGDIILNPLDDRCPYWGPSEELRRKAEAKAIAASLYQPTNDKKGEFFTETPQKIFAHLLTFGPTPQQLVEWMSNPDEIDKRVKGTELASILTPGAQQQRAGVLASLGLIADSLRMLPTKEQAKTTWSATDWAEKRDGWIFITSKAAEREALRPLHSLWIDLLVLRLLNTPEPNQRKVWFVLDELASLQRLPQLHTAITENRKSANPLVLGFQGKAQLEVIYGHMAEVMLSQPATKIFLKTTEPKAAEWVSKAIGQVEIERMKESHHSGQRAGKNFTLDRQIEPLVMDSEISGLPDKHAFLKLGNRVARFSFAYADIPQTTPDFVARNIPDDELSFDPKTLQPRTPRESTDIGTAATFTQPFVPIEKPKRKRTGKPKLEPAAGSEAAPPTAEFLTQEGEKIVSSGSEQEPENAIHETSTPPATVVPVSILSNTI